MGVEVARVKWGVSILVVMDLALQRRLIYTKATDLESFNPCCNGFSVATYTPEIAALEARLVSILVVMDLALQRTE